MHNITTKESCAVVRYQLIRSNIICLIPFLKGNN
jgi:hypothetical protein